MNLCFDMLMGRDGNFTDKGCADGGLWSNIKYIIGSSINNM